MTPWCSRPASPSALALRSISSTAILSSAIVVFLSCRRLQLHRREDDAMAVSLVGPVQLLHHVRDVIVGPIGAHSRITAETDEIHTPVVRGVGPGRRTGSDAP